jgi:hypothetical protein
MNEKIFEDCIRAQKDRALPSCPPNMEANVLRRVRLASESREASGVLEWIFGLIPQKSVALGVLTLSLFLSVISSMFVVSSSARATENQSRATVALGFEVFQENPFFDLDN